MPVLLLAFGELSLRGCGYGASNAPFRRVVIDGRHFHVGNYRAFYTLFSEAPDQAIGDLEVVVPDEKDGNTYRIFIFGESAAVGWLHDISFGQMLQVMLLRRFPGVRFELHNLAAPGLNSSQMRVLARSAAKMHPDAFLLYMGNNEVHGPYGLLSEFQVRPGRVPTPLQIRLHQQVRRLRLGQLLEHLGRRVPVTAPDDPDHQLRYDDPRADSIWRNFDDNMRHIFTSAEAAGAALFVSTLGANLKDWPPHPGLVWEAIAEEERLAFDAYLATGRRHEEADALEEALDAYRQAEAITDSSPYIAYRQGHCLWALHEFEQARKQFKRALELDSFLWVRAKQAFNDTISEAARAHGPARLVEGRAALAAASPHGVPGNELFIDACHFRPEGMHVIAEAFFHELASSMPDWVRRHENPDAAVPSVAELLVLLDARDEPERERLEWLNHRIRARGIEDAAIYPLGMPSDTTDSRHLDEAHWLHTYDAFFDTGVEDIHLAFNYVLFLLNRPRHVSDERMVILAALEERYPISLSFQHYYASLLKAIGKEADLERIYRRLLRVYPDDAMSYLELVRLLARDGRVSETQSISNLAQQHVRQQSLRHAIQQEVDREVQFQRGCALLYTDAVEEGLEQLHHALLSSPHRASEIALAVMERAETAQEQQALALAERLYRAAAATAPELDWPLVHLGDLLVEAGRTEEALQTYEQVLRGTPESPYAAQQTDRVFAHAPDPAGRVRFWRTLRQAHATAFIPALHLAQALYDAEQCGEARLLLEELVAEHPDNAAALLHLGKTHLTCGDMETGIELLHQAARLDPGSAADAAQAVSMRAEQATQDAAYDQAERLYLLAVDYAPDDLWHKVALGELYEKMNRADEALDLYTDVLLADPETPYTAQQADRIFAHAPDPAGRVRFWRTLRQAHATAFTPALYLAQALYEAEQCDESRLLLEEVVAKHPDNAAALLHLGKAHLTCGDMETGVDLLHQAAQLAPDSAAGAAQALAVRAEEATQDAAYDQAERLYLLAVDYAPDDLWHKVALGELYEKMNRAGEALEVYKEVLLAAPEWPVPAARTYRLLAEGPDLVEDAAGAAPLPVGLPDMAAGLHFWRHLVSKYPAEVIPRVYLGKTLLRAGQSPQEMEFLEEIVSQHPNNALARHGLGLVLMEQGDYENASHHLQTAVDLDALLARRIAESCAKTANDLKEAGKLVEAVRWYKLAAAIEPRHLWHRLHLGRVYEELGNIEAATQEYRHLLLKAPESPVTARQLHALLVRNETSSACVVSEWQSLVDASPEAATPRYFLGRSYELNGDTDQALACYARSLEIDPEIEDAASRIRTLTREPD